MDSFKEYITERSVSFGTNPQGQIVILAGGAASGKGFVYQYGIDITGKHLDVDEVKEMLLRCKPILAYIREKTGKDLSSFNLKNPEHVVALHKMVEGLGFADIRTKDFFKSVLLAPKDRKPNIIFDVTLKDVQKLITISHMAQSAGYDARDISIVWVLDKVSVAMEKNAQRERTVPADVLLATHVGASMTMSKFVEDNASMRQYADGYFYLVFNSVGVDNPVYKSSSGGMWMDVKGRVLLKKPGEGINSRAMTDEVVNKIRQYVPNPDVWKSISLRK